MNPTITAAELDGPMGDPDGDGYENKIEHDSYYYGYPSFDPLKTYNTAANRPVITIANSTANGACPAGSFTITRYVGEGGNYDNALTVYYSVGGNLNYSTDYTLSPAPSGQPRIFSAIIPAGEQSVTITATLIGNAVSSGTKTLVASVTPYAVSPVSQVSNPLSWTYVVDWNNNRAAIPFNFDSLRPYANEQSLSACPNGDTSITLSGYDYCGDSLTYAVLTSPEHGTLTGTAPDLVYHPNQDYLGTDSFTFKVNDGVRDSTVATISLNVDNQPSANGQNLQTCRNITQDITLTGSGGCDQPLTFAIVNAPAHGSLSGTLPDVTYHPALNYEGSDSFTFKANNGLQDSAAATVSIEVGYQPVVNGQSRVTDLSHAPTITLTGSDGCNDSLTYAVVNNPTLGSLSGTAPNLTYTPTVAGSDSFNFTANDGVRDSAVATVYIEVLPKPVLAVDCRAQSLVLTWTIPNPIWNYYVTDFVIYRSTTPGGSYGQPLATIPTSSMRFDDTTVTPGVTYYYVVGFHYTDPTTRVSYEAAVSDEASSSTCGLPTVIRPGFGANTLTRNDDWFTGIVDLPFEMNYFGTTNLTLYVNNNGNVTFANPLGIYTPTALAGLGIDIIAPFWADVDTTGTRSDEVHYGFGTVDGHFALGVNWLYVGYFSGRTEKLNVFQLVLINRSDRAAGDYDVEFNYAQIQWETGYASGGVNGFGGSPARAGFAGAGGSTFEISGSGQTMAFLDSNPVSGLIYHSFNSTIPGRYVFQFHNGVPLATP